MTVLPVEGGGLDAPDAQPRARGPASDLSGALALLRRQARPILLTAALVLAAAVAILAALPPRFEAAALLLVEAGPASLLDPDADLAAPAADNGAVDGAVEILRSDGVLLEVIRATDLVADPEFGARPGFLARIAARLRLGGEAPPSGPEALGAVLENLRAALDVRRQGRTRLVSVSLRSASPERAAALANAMVEAYTSHQVGSKIGAALAARDAIERRLERARQTLVDAEAAFGRYVSDNLDALVAAAGQAELETLRGALASLVAEQAKTSEAIRALREEIGRQDWTALLARLEEEAADELARQRRRLVSAIAKAPAGSAAETGLRAELSAVEASLSTQAEARASTLESALAAGQTRIAAARQELNAALLRADLPPDVQARFYEILQTSKNAAGLYQTLLARLQQIDAQALVQVADSRTVSEARAPTEPSVPNVPLTLAAATIVALGAGLGVGLLLDARTGGFTSADQLRHLSGRPVAAVVPPQRSAADQLSAADEVVDWPLSHFAESLRRLRAAADRALGARGPGPLRLPRCGAVVMVTSALPDEGKTTIALALGRTFAADGRRVLVIDCDLRRASVHRQLGLDPPASLADLLSGAIPDEDMRGLALRDPLSPMRVVPGRVDAAAPGDLLLRSPAFADLLDGMRSLFDVVILDTPPVGPVVDGLHLAEKADLVAFVVRAASTPQRDVLSALDALSEAAGRRTATLLVLNRHLDETARHYRAYAG